MPLTSKGEKILSNMREEYGSEKGERVFYASKNKGTISGVDSMGDKMTRLADGVEALSRRMDAVAARRDADDKWYGRNVRIKGGMSEFVGKTGRIIAKEGRMYRVKLDTPVEVPGVGKVSTDLWESSYLQTVKQDAEEEKKKIRPPTPGYNEESVNKAIAASKQKIGGKEAKLIHGLLKGRTG